MGAILPISETDAKEPRRQTFTSRDWPLTRRESPAESISEMERMELNLRDYWRIAFRWWWIILLGMLGGAVAMFLVSGAQTPIYNASIKIFVQSRQDPGLPSFSEIEASREIARNYGELGKL